MVYIYRVAQAASLDSEAGWAYEEIARLERASSLEMAGHDDFCHTASQHLLAARPSGANHNVNLLALPDPTARRALAWGLVGLPQRDNVTLADIQVITDAPCRRQGIGRAVHAELARLARAAGRTRASCWTYCATEPPPGPGALVPPTGSGRVPADGATTGFVRALGYELDQVERASRLDLPEPPGLLERLYADAVAMAGGAYRTVCWAGDTPPELREAVARLNTALTADAPQGPHGAEPEVWDGARVRETDARRRAAGVDAISCVAQEVATGAVVGLTQLTLPRAHPGAVFQENTVVERAHRGHRLGMLIKARNVMQLAEVAPEAQRVHTWNAEENDHMLAINIAMGFRPAGVEGQWVASL